MSVGSVGKTTFHQLLPAFAIKGLPERCRTVPEKIEGQQF
jgi:hypothetical protein